MFNNVQVVDNLPRQEWNINPDAIALGAGVCFLGRAYINLRAGKFTDSVSDVAKGALALYVLYLRRENQRLALDNQRLRNEEPLEVHQLLDTIRAQNPVQDCSLEREEAATTNTVLRLQLGEEVNPNIDQMSLRDLRRENQELQHRFSQN